MNLETGSISAGQPIDLGNDPIPAKAYYDPEWYELERQAVFMRSWIQCGHISEIPEPGSFIRREFEFARASLLITRGRDGEVRAMHNVCTHRGTQLTQESCGKQSKFSCKYHMWTFGSDGALLSAPDFERFGIDKSACALPRVACEVVAGLIFVNFDPQQSLREYLGPLADQMETVPVARATCFSEYVYEINANWKLTYDNFQENYHLRFIHPKTGEATFDESNPFGYPEYVELHDPHRTQRIWTNPNAAERMTPFQMMKFGAGMKRLAEDGLIGAPTAKDYFALFPNFFMLGSPGNNFSHTVMPLGPEKSRGVIRLYWVGEDRSASTRFAREAAMATTRDIHGEDVSVIEAGQRGLSSGALEHILFQEKEVLCRHLYLMVAKAVADHQAGKQ